MTWKRNTKNITEYNARYSEELDGYRAFAEKRRNNRVYKQEQLTGYVEKLKLYVEEKSKANKPFTVAGVLLALGLNSMTWSRFRDGEYDFLLEEYLQLNNITDNEILYDEDGLPFVLDNNRKVTLIPYSVLYEKTMLMIQEEREEKCSSLRGNPAGNIFLLKAQMGFKEEEAPQTLNQTLVIADRDKALEALKLLG